MIQPLLQIVVALGIFNVWLLRANQKTAYRGGDSGSIFEEFQTYGLPYGMVYLVGGLKLLAASALLIGLWMPALVAPAAGLIAILMGGALAMHYKVKDPLQKSMPAAIMLILCLAILYTSTN